MDFAAASLRKGEVGETRGGGKVDLDQVRLYPGSRGYCFRLC